MAVTIQVGRQFAAIDNYQWESSNKVLEKALNSLLNKNGPSPSDPYPDHTAAINAVKVIGGKIVKVDPMRIPLEKDRVY